MLSMLIRWVLLWALTLAPLQPQTVVIYAKKDNLNAGSYNGTSSLMTATGTINADFSFTIFADCESGSSVGANRSFAAISEAAAAGDRVHLHHTNTGALRCTVQTSDGSNAAAQHGTVLSTTTKYKMACISTTNADRHVCHSGTCVQSTTSLSGTVAAIDTTTLGVLTLGSNTGFFNGKCKEVGMWITALTTTNYTDYNSGSETLESLGADYIYRAASGTNLGDVAGNDLTPTDVTAVIY